MALQQIDNGAKDVSAIGRAEEGCIKLGIFSSLVSGFSFEVLRAYEMRHRSVLVELFEGDAIEHAAAVRQL